MPGHKTYNIGDEVLAADFNPFVMDQIVAVYASAAARTAGWPTPPNGAVSYLQDHPGQLYVYNGTAWILAGSGAEIAHYEQATDVGIPGALSYMGFGLGSLPMIAGRIYRIDFFVQISHAAASTVNLQLRTGAAGSEATHSNIIQRGVYARGAGTFESYYVTGRFVAAATGTGTTCSVWASTSGTATMVQGGGAFTQLRAFDVGTT